jgi:hypothetical protein
MDTVTVKYGHPVNLEAALRCHRCLGGGRERFGPDAGEACPRCAGTGEHADGWAYQANGFTLNVGDVVEVPPTPRSAGKSLLATVVRIGSENPNPHKRVLRLAIPAVSNPS